VEEEGDKSEMTETEAKDQTTKEGGRGGEEKKAKAEAEAETEKAASTKANEAINRAADDATAVKETKKTAATRRGSFAVIEDPKRFKIVFDEKLGKDYPGKKLTRYQVNPRDNWGPMSRAKGHS